EPDYGYLLDNMFFSDGDTIPVDRFIVPRVEVELTFILDKPLKGPKVTIQDVLRATEYVQPALEIVDGRTMYPRRIADNIADNAASAGIILGGRPVRPMDIDLRWVGCLLYLNGVIEETGVSAGVMGHPARGVEWLANKLATFGTSLEAGDVILAGSFTRTVPVKAGDTVHADFGELGGISIHFENPKGKPRPKYPSTNSNRPYKKNSTNWAYGPHFPTHTRPRSSHALALTGCYSIWSTPPVKLAPYWANYKPPLRTQCHQWYALPGKTPSNKSVCLTSVRRCS